MTTTCDLNVDWNECPNCDLLKERIEVADAATRAAEVRVDCAWNEYLEARNNGLAYFCSPQYRAYHARIDNLEQALAEAHAAQTADIEAWAASIHEHHRLYEARQQEAEDSSKDVAVETEEMVTISKAEAVDELVNVYGGHIDKWLEALRERTHVQTDADDVRTPCACAMCTTLDKDNEDAEPTAAERDAYFAARDHADDADTPDAPGRRTAVRIVAYDAHKGGCHEADPTDVPVWLLDTPNTAIARDVRQATLQGIRALIDDLIDGGGQ